MATLNKESGTDKSLQGERAKKLYREFGQRLDLLEEPADSARLENFRRRLAYWSAQADCTADDIKNAASIAEADILANDFLVRLDYYVADERKGAATECYRSPKRHDKWKAKRAKVTAKACEENRVGNMPRRQQLAVAYHAFHYADHINKDSVILSREQRAALFNYGQMPLVIEEPDDPLTVEINRRLDQRPPNPFPYHQFTYELDEFMRDENATDWVAFMKAKAEAATKKPAAPEPTEPPAKSKFEFDVDPPEIAKGDDDDEDDEDDKNRFWSPPHDFWNAQPTETLRPGMLPPWLEPIVFEFAERKGLNADALALALLTVLSSAIPTNIRVAENEDYDNTFIECIRLYSALIGRAGSGKSPLTLAAMRAAEERDEKLAREFGQRIKDYDDLSADDKKEADKPVRERAIAPNNFSTESIQKNFSENPDGLLSFHDELVQFFGSKSQYSSRGGGGEQVATGFWLSAYDSRRFTQTRMNRPDVDCVPSVSILGGIQPKIIKDIAEQSTNVGLVQRFNFAILPDHPAKPNKNLPVRHPTTDFDQRYHELFKHMPTRLTGATLHFDEKAAITKDRFFEWVDEQALKFEQSNPALSSHLHKYKGMFLRFCGLYHMTEHYDEKFPRRISHDTATRVWKYFTSVRFANAKAFFAMLMENEENNDMKNIAEFILAHGLTHATAREMQQGSARLRKISTKDIAHTAGNMVSLGWLHVIAGKRVDTFRWKVNPDVHLVFQHRAGIVRKEFARRQETFDTIIAGLAPDVAKQVKDKLARRDFTKDDNDAE